MNRVQTLRNHLQDPLYRNGYALMLNTGLTAFLGFIYWLLAAHIYAASVVGRASAQVAAMMLISAITQVNFTSVLIRFLPRAGTQSRRLVLTCYGIATLFAACIATLIMVVAHFATDAGSPLHLSMPFAIWFVISTSFWSIFNLQDGTMTGLRRTIWVPVENGSFNVLKIILLFAFKPAFGDTGIFASTTIPVLISLAPVNFAIFKIFIPRHTIETRERQQALETSRIRKYIAGDYVSTLFAQAMTTLMPVLVVGVLGSTDNAYFFVAQTMGMTLDLIAFNLASSLTVEAAGHEDRIAELSRAVLRRTLTLVIPLAAFLFLAAPYLLRLFGQQYEDHATTLLRLLVISSLPKVVISFHGALARLKHKTYRNAIFTSIQAVMLIGGSIIFMSQFGINGVGYAAIISQTLVALLVLPWMLKTLEVSNLPRQAESVL